MARESYKDWQPGEKLTAEHVNLLNRAARLASSLMSGSFGSGMPGVQASLPPFQQRLVIVTNSDNQSNVQIRLRYYNALSGEWVTDDSGEGYLLDASSIEMRVEVDDVLTAWWDAQRGAYIPIPVSSSTPVLLARTTKLHRLNRTEPVKVFLQEQNEEGDEEITSNEMAYNRLFDSLPKYEWIYIAEINGRYEIISARPMLLAATTTVCHPKGKVEPMVLAGEEGASRDVYNRFADLQDGKKALVGVVSHEKADQEKGRYEIVAANPCEGQEEQCEGYD